MASDAHKSSVIDPNKTTPGAEKSARAQLEALAPWLLDDFRALSKNAGFTTIPLIYIDRKRDTYVEATKWAGFDTVVINEKALKENSRKKMRGVIGHELAHIKLGHTADISVAKPYAGFLYPAESRKAEEAADKLGSVIAGGIEGLVDFLRASSRRREVRRGALGRLVNRSPLMQGFKNLYQSHPTHQKRIADLERFSAEHAAELQAGKSSLERFLDLELSRGFTKASARPTVEKHAVPANELRNADKSRRYLR